MSKAKPTTAERRVMALIRANALNDPNSKCLCCGEAITTKNISVDHIQPKSLGYKITELGNYQVLCKNCNNKKGMLSIDYKTKTLIIEPYMFNLSEDKLINLLVRGDLRNPGLGPRKLRGVHLQDIKKKLQTKFTVK